MAMLDQRGIDCPYCGESIEVLIDESDAGTDYIEDCQVCCRPILFSVHEDFSGQLLVTVRSENE